MDSISLKIWRERFELQGFKTVPNLEYEVRLLNAAAAADSPALPLGYERRLNRGPIPRIYYVNVIKKTASWKHPVSGAFFLKPLNVPPPNPLDECEIRILKDGRLYFANKRTKEGTYTNPIYSHTFSTAAPTPWELKIPSQLYDDSDMPTMECHFFNTKTKSLSDNDPRKHHYELHKTYLNMREVQQWSTKTRPHDYLLSVGSTDEEIFASSYKLIMDAPAKALRSIRIAMYLPHNTDGVSPEQLWVNAVFRELYNPARKIFKPYVHGVQLNLDFEHEDGLKLLRFAGRMHAIVIVHQLSMDLSYSFAFYNTLKLTLSKRTLELSHREQAEILAASGNPVEETLRPATQTTSEIGTSAARGGTISAGVPGQCLEQNEAQAKRRGDKWSGMATTFIDGLLELHPCHQLLKPFVEDDDLFAFQLALLCGMDWLKVFRLVEDYKSSVLEHQEETKKLRAAGVVAGLPIPEADTIAHIVSTIEALPMAPPVPKGKEEEEEERVSVADLASIGLYKL